MIPGLFISGVSTAVGKTFLTRGLARALVLADRRPAAIKPLETGVDPDPLDALALARACGRPALAHAPGLYRARLPLAPYAAALETDTAPPELSALADHVRDACADATFLLVEGAGGLLVPIDARHDVADLATALALPLLLVARDELGVLSHVLVCAESARSRGLLIAAVVLSQHAHTPDDPSPRTNRRILEQRLAVPVLPFPHCPNDDDALAQAAIRCGLLDLCS